jgi:ligand-binding sensor domain-containing protein/signal transduction histidine kinase
MNDTLLMRAAPLRAAAAVSALLLAVESRALEPARLIGQYAHEVWLPRDGLPASPINSILQTRDGYLWLATHSGLARFDGVRFVVLDARTAPELTADSFWVLAEDARGGLWIGTEGRGLYGHRDGRFTSYLRDSGLVHRSIRSLAPGPEGVWVGTYGDGLQLLTDAGFERRPLPDGHIRAILLDHSGRLWVGTQHGLVRTAAEPRSELTVFGHRDIQSDIVTSLWEDRRGALWVGTDAGLSRFAEGKWTSYAKGETFAAGAVNALLEDRHGNLWIGTTAGLYRFQSGRFSRFAKMDGLSDDEVLSLYEDREGSLWVGTREGLNRFWDTPFFPLASDEVPFMDATRSLCATRDGSVWINTDKRGLHRLKDGLVRTFTTRQGLYRDSGGPLYEGRDGSLWIGTQGGLTQLKDGRLTPYPIEGGLYVSAISEDDQGLILALAQSGGRPLRRFQGGRSGPYSLRDGSTVSGIPYVYCLLAGEKGTLWLGTTEGLGRIQEGQYSRKLAEEGVHAIYQDRTGTLWLATRAGLVRYRDEKATRYTREQGLPCEWLTGIAEDDSGRLWLSSSRGIFRVARSQLEEVAAGKAGQLSVDSYGVDDGIRSLDSDRTSQPNVIRDPNGKLWFAGPRGPSVVDPRGLSPNTVTPPVVIESVLADARPVRPGEELPPGRTDFEIQYTALSFRAPGKVQFKYELEGLDEDWVEARTRRVAHYTRIPPGRYRFRVKACNDSGLWNEEGASVSFTLAPRFYQTWTFFFLAVLALGSSAALLLRINVRRGMRQVEERFNTILAERTRMAHEFHDTFEQSLIGIKLQLEAAAAASQETAARHLSRAYELTLQSVSEAHHSIWALRSGILEHQDLDAALAALVRQATAETRIRCQVRADSMPLPQELKDQILRIAQEAITNAVRHGRPANLAVHLTYERGSVRLRVRDDGCGFDTEEASRRKDGRFGLLGMRERAERLGGQISVRSRKGEGTEIEVTVPIGARGGHVGRAKNA